MPDREFDRLVIGGGVVGLAVAREILRRKPGLRLGLLEKEAGLARHQTGHNSGVIHSGVYYKPGSLKARLCLEGRRKLLAFCDERAIPYRLDGKLIVAVEEAERPALRTIRERGQANGVEGLRLIGPEEIREHEPHARGVEAIHVPSAGIVNYGAVAAALAEGVQQEGGEILMGVRATRIHVRAGAPIVETSAGTVAAARIVCCAGLQSDRLAGEAAEDVRIVPFRGDYYLLSPEARRLTRALIYPVPDPQFPFLGVHLTRRMDGEVLAGPNAVLALAREGYGRLRASPRDAWSALAWPGFWRLARRHWKTGIAEVWRDLVKSAYLDSLRKFVPELCAEDLRPGPCGIRAQAVRRDGTLVDDFVIRREESVTHVVNAPSPAATSSFAIAREIVDRVEDPEAR